MNRRGFLGTLIGLAAGSIGFFAVKAEKLPELSKISHRSLSSYSVLGYAHTKRISFDVAGRAVITHFEEVKLIPGTSFRVPFPPVESGFRRVSTKMQTDLCGNGYVRECRDEEIPCRG